MERHQVLQELLALFDDPAYLEIGVDKGETFHSLRAGSKTAVDPVFSFDVEAARQRADNGNCRYFALSSDRFFEMEAPMQRFDVIYIDGLHTFEQTLRDFLNAAAVLKPGGVIVIDDVIPASYAASIPDLDLSRRFWQATANPDGSWMGDVYKLVFFIHHFMPAYSYATVAENHGQTVVWQSARALPSPVFATVEALARASYVDVVMNAPLFNISAFPDIVSRLRGEAGLSTAWRRSGATAAQSRASRPVGVQHQGRERQGPDRQVHEGVSCAPRDLYTREEWHDPQIPFERIHEVSEPAGAEFEVLRPVFARHEIRRPMPASVAGPSSGDIDALLAHYTDINARYASASPSVLVRIATAIVWRNMVFVEAGGDVIPLYENFRIIDRQEKGADIADALRARTDIHDLDGEGAAILFFGSVGSFNYGHWLIDDFARYAGLALAERQPLCLFSRLNDPIDRIRQEGLALVSGPAGCASRFVDPEVPVRVKDLLYVTPCSEHPFLKSPHALAHLRDLGRRITAAGAPGRRLFVNRTGHWPRRLSNLADLSPVLREHGFVEFVTDGLSLREQIAAFAQAERVVGIMGASMANTVFCAPGTPLLYLAPSGWPEPFFWDQAAACGQPYHVLFGTSEPSDPHSLHQKSFAVDPQQLSAALHALAAGTPVARAGLPGR